MADLHETLEKREKRSKIAAFLVGLAIVLAIVLVVVLFNNRSTDDRSGVVETSDVAENSDEASDTIVDLGLDMSTEQADSDDATTNDDNAEVGDTLVDNAEVDAPQSNDASEPTTTEEELPNTGPAENAIVGILAITVVAQLFVRSRKQLTSALRSR